MPTIGSTREAQAAVHSSRPEAIRFQSVIRNNQRIGWTYCTRPGAYGWVLTTGRISTVAAASRETAEHNARNTHRP